MVRFYLSFYWCMHFYSNITCTSVTSTCNYMCCYTVFQGPFTPGLYPKAFHSWLISQGPFTPGLFLKALSLLTNIPRSFHSWQLISQGPFTPGSLHPKALSLLAYIPRPFHSWLISQGPFTPGLHPQFLFISA